MKQANEIAEVTTVSSAQAPKTLQPGKCPFHYPAAGGMEQSAFSSFFLAAADMLFKSVNINFSADSDVVVALVQTKMTHRHSQKPTAHLTGFLQSYPNQATVMHIGSPHYHPQGNTLHMQMDFAAASSSVCRVAAKTFSR